MQRIEIPLYINKVELSAARQKKYYELGKVPPKAKKYANRKLFKHKQWPGFGKREFLVEEETGERVVANPKAAGTPKVTPINGQKIYNGEVSMFTRNKVISAIKESFMPYVDTLKEVNHPVNIIMEVHDEMKTSHQLWDLDNRAMPYIKAFQDCLTGNKERKGTYRCKRILEDDNILYVTGVAYKFVAVANEKERKLVFIIVEDKNVLSNKIFKKVYNEIRGIFKGRKLYVEKG
jgi:hypothetical protein